MTKYNFTLILTGAPEWTADMADADELKKQQASSEEYRRALAVMRDDPVEPAANLAAGRYLCVERQPTTIDLIWRGRQLRRQPSIRGRNAIPFRTD